MKFGRVILTVVSMAAAVFLTVPSAEAALEPGPVISSLKRLKCYTCWWEGVIATNPSDENFSYILGNGGMAYTNNGWLTRTLTSVNDIAAGAATRYSGDPQISFDAEGRLSIVSLGSMLGKITGALYKERSAMQNIPVLEESIIKQIPATTTERMIFDFPKLTYNTSAPSDFFNSAYIFANKVFFAEDNSAKLGMFIIRGGAVTEKKAVDVGLPDGLAIQDAVVGANGTVYAGRHEQYDGKVAVYYSTGGGVAFERGIAGTYVSKCSGRALVSTSASTSWAVDSFDLVADKKSPKVYALWAQPNQQLAGQICRNYEIYSSFTEDDGVSWSEPVMVSDDISGGDQVFPSAAIDEKGDLYVAFFDHRERQELAQFDVYVAVSRDGGMTFSKNTKVNDISIPNYGARHPGDYLDMVAAGKQRVDIFHPCVESMATSLIDSCIATIFTDPQLGALETPGLPVPSDGSNVEAPVVLDWKDSVGASSYDVYFSKGAELPGAPVASGLTSSRWTIPANMLPLTVGATYYWQVVARNSKAVVSGSVWKFSVESLPHELGIPADPVPASFIPIWYANHAHRVSPNITALDWSADGAVTFDVYLGEQPEATELSLGAVPVASDLTESRWAVPAGTLKPAKEYFWKVVSRSPGGIFYGPAWHFVTQSNMKVLRPAGGETWPIGAPQQITWTAPSSINNVRITLQRYEPGVIAGIPITVVSASAPNTGVYNWTLPPTVESGQYVVAIRDAASSVYLNMDAGQVPLNVAPANERRGDLDGSGRVDVLDLGILLSSWGRMGIVSSDLNGDTMVNVLDLGILLSNWT